MIGRIILGDQLNPNHSWFEHQDENVLYIFMEVRGETDYVVHHIQKIASFFAAMRNFAQALKKQKHRVVYIKINDKDNEQSFIKNLAWLKTKYDLKTIAYQTPDEYRVKKIVESIASSLEIETQAYSTEHFMVEIEWSKQFFDGKKSYIMEYFYRAIRKQYDLLMDGEKPIGGKWNYDSENRKKWIGKDEVPPKYPIENDVQEINDEISKANITYIGHVAPKINYPINEKQAQQALTFFLTHSLQYFGKYQDAMHSEEEYLFHSRISFALNTKIINPLYVVQEAISYWNKNQQKISIAQIEGFVRQIIGWREYMRAIYWIKMPEYATLNFFNHNRKLPQWYWTGDTKMNCLSQCINNSLDNAYAHHIQRLMVTGNFALLAGIDPSDVDAWYLGIYADALEWVQMTNTRGMSQYADGGIVGTKPYVSSANYIDKMSNYCKNCHYDKKKKIGYGACPFNALYWHFYERNRPLLGNNPRVSMMYRVWDKQSKEQKVEILQQASTYLEEIESL